MQYRRSLLFLLCALCLHLVKAQAPLPSNQPNEVQRRLIERGYGMFIHFGPNTFLQQEWSDGTAPASVYAPTALDCDQWVRVAKEAGFRYVLLVTKHHDGFCLWDSQWTDYDVASSPEPTDVVRAVSDACRKYGLQFAVYYSLWDRHEPTYREKDFGKYIQYMERQLTELMTQYGEVCELWLDGAWDKPVDDWQIPRLYKLVRRLQPYCAIGVNHTVAGVESLKSYQWGDLVLPDSCNRDNRYYLRFFPSDFRLWDPMIAPLYDKKQYLHNGVSYYQPFEHTICLSKSWNWFQKDKPMPVRDLDELEELFYWTTSNDNTLVIDLAPDRTGRIRPHEVDRIVELRQRLGIEYGKPLPRRRGDIVSMGARAEASSVYPSNNGNYTSHYAVDGGMQTRWASADGDLTPWLSLDFGQEKTFDKFVIFEYQDQHQGDDGFSNIRTGRIQQYTLDIWQDGQWIPIYVGDETIGDCKVIRLPHSYQSPRVRLCVLRATLPPSIYELLVINES